MHINPVLSFWCCHKYHTCTQNAPWNVSTPHGSWHWPCRCAWTADILHRGSQACLPVLRWARPPPPGCGAARTAAEMTGPGPPVLQVSHWVTEIRLSHHCWCLQGLTLVGRCRHTEGCLGWPGSWWGCAPSARAPSDSALVSGPASGPCLPVQE